MRKLTGERVAVGAARAIEAVPDSWREPLDHASLDELIRNLPVLSILAALGFAPDQCEAMLSSADTWVVGLSPLATDTQRRSAIEAKDRLLRLLAANGVQGLDESAAHVAVLMQPA